MMKHGLKLEFLSCYFLKFLFYKLIFYCWILLLSLEQCLGPLRHSVSSSPAKERGFRVGRSCRASLKYLGSRKPSVFPGVRITPLAERKKDIPSARARGPSMNTAISQWGRMPAETAEAGDWAPRGQSATWVDWGPGLGLQGCCSMPGMGWPQTSVATFGGDLGGQSGWE